MGRYYFDLHNGDGPTRDEQGREFSSRAKIAEEVTRILLDIARDEMPDGDRGIISLTVRDDNNRAVSIASLTFNREWLDP